MDSTRRTTAACCAFTVCRSRLGSERKNAAPRWPSTHTSRSNLVRTMDPKDFVTADLLAQRVEPCRLCGLHYAPERGWLTARRNRKQDVGGPQSLHSIQCLRLA